MADHPDCALYVQYQVSRYSICMPPDIVISTCMPLKPGVYAGCVLYVHVSAFVCQVAKHRHACLSSLERILRAYSGGACLIDKLSHAQAQSQRQDFKTGQSKFDSATAEN